MTLRRTLYALGALALFAGGGVAWWLVSPLFLTKTVREGFPLGAEAILPGGMGRQEAEAMMAGLSKLRLEMREPMPASSDQPRRLRAGAFRDGDAFHKGSGQALLYRLPDGSHLLRLENLNVTNGPALHVYLVRHADPQKRADVTGDGFVDLGRLKGNIGEQNYPLPPGAGPAAYGSVVIFCRPFQVIFSVVSLKDAR